VFDVEVNGNIADCEAIEAVSIEIMQNLMPRTTRPINITIDFVTHCDSEVAGDCHGDKNDVFINIAKNSFGYAYTVDEQLLTLCHELVHAKQFLKGQLSESGKIWKGVDMSMMTHIKQQPWEQEAFQLELELYKKHIRTQENKS
jgi:hypothetical protein|tara:strand:+ start:1746 stop:2177 length:432 start_codon:yes stop_codon:yes gene_type:complete